MKTTPCARTFKFETQLAGILVLQAPDRVAQPGAETGDVYHDSILHNIPAVDLPERKLTQNTALELDVVENGGPTSGMGVHPPAFRQFCEENPVANAPVDLEVGDMYSAKDFS